MPKNGWLIGRRTDRDAFLGEQPAHRVEEDRLRIDDHAVHVQENSLQRQWESSTISASARKSRQVLDLLGRQTFSPFLPLHRLVEAVPGLVGGVPSLA